MVPLGIEPRTYCVLSRCDNQLHHGTLLFCLTASAMTPSFVRLLIEFLTSRVVNFLASTNVACMGSSLEYDSVNTTLQVCEGGLGTEWSCTDSSTGFSVVPSAFSFSFFFLMISFSLLLFFSTGAGFVVSFGWGGTSTTCFCNDLKCVSKADHNSVT